MISGDTDGLDLNRPLGMLQLVCSSGIGFVFDYNQDLQCVSLQSVYVFPVIARFLHVVAKFGIYLTKVVAGICSGSIRERFG